MMLIYVYKYNMFHKPTSLPYFISMIVIFVYYDRVLHKSKGWYRLGCATIRCVDVVVEDINVYNMF